MSRSLSQATRFLGIWLVQAVVALLPSMYVPMKMQSDMIKIMQQFERQPGETALDRRLQALLVEVAPVEHTHAAHPGATPGKPIE
jgi:hypothetical protein